MRTVLAVTLTLLGVFFGAISTAYAWYIPPTPETLFGDERFAIAVVMVESWDDGAARVSVEESVYGSPTSTEISTVEYSCHGLLYLEPGQRYLVMLLDDSIAEDSSYFPINAANQVELDAHYTAWFGVVSSTVDLDDLKARIDELAP